MSWTDNGGFAGGTGFIAMPTMQDIKRLEDQIAALEKRIATLERHEQARARLT